MNYSPTLILGLGPTGKSFLNRLKSALNLRAQTEPVEKVELFWIGLDFDSGTTLDIRDAHGLSPAEMIGIPFDKTETGAEIEDPIIRENFAWWAQAQQSDLFTRADGRMAYFWDIQFRGNPRWHENFAHIQRKFSGAGDTHFRLFVVASLSEVEFAMIPDLVDDFRFGLLKGWVSGVYGWFFLEDDANNRLGQTFREDQKSNMRAAAMRELKRFMLGQPQVLDHGTQIPTVAQQILFDHIFLFESPAVLQPASDLMLVILENDAARRISTDIPPRMINSLAISTASILTYILPIAEVHRYCGSLLARELLFSYPSREILPGGILPLSNREHNPEFPVLKEDIEGDVSRFLTETIEANLVLRSAYPLPLLASAARGGWAAIGSGDLPGDIYTAFQERLEVFMSREMNAQRDATRYDEARRQQRIFNPLSWAAQFLKQLAYTLSNAEYVLLQQSSQGHAAALALHEALPRFRKLCVRFREQVEAWNDAVLKLVYPQIERRFLASQAQLEQVVQESPGRQVVLPNARQEFPAYHLYLEKLHLPQGRRAVEDLKRLWQWEWKRDQEGRPELVCKLPDGIHQQHEFYLGHLGETSFYQIWFELAFQATRSFIESLSIVDVLQQSPAQLNDRNMVALLDAVPQPGQGRVTGMYLIGSDPIFLEAWSKSAGLMRTGHGILPSEDSSRITLMRIDYNLPYQASRRLVKDERQHRSGAWLYAQPAEQKAAQIEQELDRRRRKYLTTGFQRWKPVFPTAYRFSPDFVSIMADGEMFDAVMLLVFFDKIRYQEINTGHWGWQIVWDNNVAIPLYEADQFGDDLRAALVAILIYYPYQGYDNAHPLFHSNYRATMRRVIQSLGTKPLAPSPDLDPILERAVSKMDRWETSEEAFYQDLSMYQRYLYVRAHE